MMDRKAAEAFAEEWIAAWNSHDLVHTHTTRDLTRAIRAAVIDYEHLDTGDTRDVVRQIRDRRREVLALVKAGDLDD